MRRSLMISMAMAALLCTGVALAEPPKTVRRSNTMEFDPRLIQGQAPRAGAVYLFQRAPRRLPELVQLRPRYIRKIVVPLLGERAFDSRK